MACQVQLGSLIIPVSDQATNRSPMLRRHLNNGVRNIDLSDRYPIITSEGLSAAVNYLTTTKEEVFIQPKDLIPTLTAAVALEVSSLVETLSNEITSRIFLAQTGNLQSEATTSPSIVSQYLVPTSLSRENTEEAEGSLGHPDTYGSILKTNLAHQVESDYVMNKEEFQGYKELRKLPGNPGKSVL